jgi:hypothetical protein
MIPKSQNLNIFARKKTCACLIERLFGREIVAVTIELNQGALRGNKNQLRSDSPDVVVEISSLGVVDCQGDAIRFAHVASSSFVSGERASLAYATKLLG